jgi:hypothetical protein
MLRRPGRSMLVVLALGLITAVLGNALFMQKGRHPAPLFVAPAAETAQRTAPKAALPPAPAPRPVELAGKSDAARSDASSSTPKPAAAKPQADSDPIGSLLRGGGGQQGAVATDPIMTKRVMAVQRALQKLGYEVAPDGVFGAGSRAALQKFERERNMTVTGELDPRTLRALATRSGVPIP